MTKKQDEKKSLQLAKLFPNMITLLGLCAGLSSIRWALDEKWELSMSLILIATIIDALDGRLARMMNASSDFGAQLDSLADFINFGVAPALIMYMWQTHEIKTIGWAVSMFYVICAAIRLARFNADIDSDAPKPEWAAKFFVGIPSPAAALIALGPLVFIFAFKDSFPDIYEMFEWFTEPAVVCLYLAVVALMMASRIPTFSFKKITIKRNFASLILAIAGIVFISFVTAPWNTLFFIGILYFISIPISIFFYYRHLRQ